MGNLTNDNDQLMINVFTDLKSNEYPINNTMVNLDIDFSTLSQKDLMNLSGNNNLNENSLIFSCFDYKNTIDNFNKELSGYPYRQNNLFFINDEQYIFPLNYNVLNNKNFFYINDLNKITISIDDDLLLFDADKNILTPNIKNIKKATAFSNGLFKINNETLIVDNRCVNIIYDYRFIINNFANIYEKTNKLIDNSNQKINEILKLPYQDDYINNLVNIKSIEIDQTKNLIYEDDKSKIELGNFNRWNDWYYKNWDDVIQNKDKESGLFFPQIVESIDIDNDVFFDTGIIPDNTYGIYYKFSRNQVDIPNNISPDENNFKAALFIGCRNNSNGFKMYIYSQEYKNNQSSEGNGYFIFWNKNSNKINGNLDKDIVHEIKLNFKNNKKVTFDNSNEKDLNSGVFETGYSIYIGTINNNGSAHPHRESHKFYGAQITKENKVIAEYYPAMQGSTKCIYDKINKKVIYPFGDLRNKNERNYYHYFPQYYIDKGINDFNIIVPFIFKYSSIYGFPNYIEFIKNTDIIESVKIYKVVETKKSNIYKTIDEINFNYNEYFNEYSAFDPEFNSEILKIFTEEEKSVLIFNKNRSYILDYNIDSNTYEGKTNVYTGTFNMVLNFTVNHKSDFDLCKIIVKFSLGEKVKSHGTEEMLYFINEELPIMLRFCNSDSNKVNLGNNLFYNDNEGFNFIGHGKLIGKCCIPENFFNKNNTSDSVLKFYKKPVFITIDKYSTRYDSEFDIPQFNILPNNHPLKKLECLNSEFDYINYLFGASNGNNDVCEKLPLIFYYINKIFRNNSKYITNLGNINKSLHYIKNLYRKGDYGQLIFLEIEEITNIYDYELDKLNRSYKCGENIYLKANDSTGQVIPNCSKIFESKKILNTINYLPQIKKIYGNGLSKGDYYLPNFFECYLINKLNINEKYTLLTTLYKNDDNTYKIIGIDPNNSVSPILYKIHGSNNNLPDSHLLFKIPDYSLLVSDNYYMYFDEEDNYYIVDYFGSYINDGYLSFNIKKNYSFAKNLKVKDKNFNDDPISNVKVMSNNIINIKTYLREYFVCYEDSDPDMNIINNEYRILFKVFIKK